MIQNKSFCGSFASCDSAKTAYSGKSQFLSYGKNALGQSDLGILSSSILLLKGLVFDLDFLHLDSH